MGRDDKFGFKYGNARRKARSKDQDSDESDEDFIIAEGEEHESDEYCSSLDPDESEEALGEFEFEEEEEITMKVKKPDRSKTRKSGSAKRAVSRKTRKKKNRFSYKQDDDDEFTEDDDDEFTEDDDDVEFIPDEADYVDCEDEIPVIKRKKVSYKEEEDDGDENEEDEEDGVEEDDQEFTLDGISVDEEDNISVQNKNKKVRTPRSRERVTVQGRKRKRNVGVMKKLTSTMKKKRTTRRLARKTSYGIVSIPRLVKKPSSDTDEEFVNRSVVENRGKKIPVARGNFSLADSDSDFLCSPASDDEYTIPEENREDRRLVGNTSTGIVAISRLERKSDSGTGGEFANKRLVGENRSGMKISGLREKIVLNSDSDADFIRMESSDDEYTIPEEEKEHHSLVEQTSSAIVAIPRLARKTSSGTDGEFANKNLGVEYSSKKIPLRRRRKFVAVSDSDFTCSASSDYEYTISEEERELVKEADEMGDSLKTNLRSSSSLKKFKEDKDTFKQRKRPGRKGKEKLEDFNKVVKQVCGICLSEEEKRTVRGTLNCCSHFFCFACIMEWSKVESRCPLCKQRFVTISKPARSVSGFDLRTVVIQIPECDQVYQPSEEELRGFLDPYDGVICTECQQSGDDALMLLCDICDSPAHTYCVGLGSEVPEGNWYCEGCRPAASSALNPNGLNSVLDQRISNNLSGMSSPVHNVRGLDLNSLYVPETPLAQQPGPFPITRRFGSQFHVTSPTFGSGAFTVYDRRRIQRQVHYILNTRRNYSSIQSNGMPPTTSGIRLFGSQINGSTGPAIQRTVTPEMRTLQYASLDERLHYNTTTTLPNRDASSARSIQLSELGQNPEHVGSSMSFNPFNSRLSYDHLHPCSSRSNIDSDGPSYTFRETTIPSRTSQ